ncbi:GFA family protein [Labrenzia sp. PHM005]|uniref:GFA family protein n=1 Tax=Labrenzia sp. PHM005 TaxID=2590016 RepID=UPI00113FF5D6|nr:GFA family protein [Labrenzia sp. PHM005]QDG78339.1 GFA family protein [Labrenzia sp. PHM005]
MPQDTASLDISLPVKGACHCGTVSYEMTSPPKHAVKCNCSICRSLGTVWGHGSTKNIKITAKPDATIKYVWGDKQLAFHSCKTCGATTHWEGIAGDAIGRMAVNLCLADPGTIEAIGLRSFDGAETWKFLD